MRGEKSIGVGILWLLFLSIFAMLFYFQKPQETVNITVSPKWVNQAQFAGMFVAKEHGLYEKRNLHVRFKEFNEKSSPLDDVVQFNSTFSLLSADEFLRAYDNGAPIKAIAAIYQTSPFAVVSLKSHNIESPVNLKGKILGVKGGKGAEADIIYEILLKSVGLSLQDVTLKHLPFGDHEKDDVVKERVDTIGLYRTDQLYKFTKENIPFNIIYPERYGTNIYNDVIVVNTFFLENNPVIVEKFLTATVEGWGMAINDKEIAINATMKYVTNPLYKDREYEEYIYKQSIPLIVPKSDTVIGAMSHDRWQQLANALYQRGVIKQIPNINDAFTNEYLP